MFKRFWCEMFLNGILMFILSLVVNRFCLYCINSDYIILFIFILFEIFLEYKMCDVEYFLVDWY